MNARSERGFGGAIAGLIGVLLVEGLLLAVSSRALGQEQQLSAQTAPDGSRIDLAWSSGGKVDLKSFTTPYVAMHFVGAMSVADVQRHMEAVKTHAPEDAGIVHLFVVSNEAEPACEAHDGGLVRLVRDEGGKAASLLKIDTGMHTVVLLDRGGKELGRVESPHSYSEISAEVRSATKAPALTEYNLPKGATLALEGYDPVVYFSLGKAVKGSKSIATVFRGVTYQFSTNETLSSFAMDPERYLPTYGGWCASAMGDKGTKVEIDPKNFKVKDGRLFLFYRSLFGDAKTDWNKHEKEWEPAADKNWKTLTGEDAIVPVKR